jgi:IS5 family transposase
VKRIARPFAGRASSERRRREKERWFRRVYWFHAGIEGRTHALGRDYHFKRCRDHGEEDMGRWIGWGVLAYNLSKVADVGSARKTGEEQSRRSW